MNLTVFSRSEERDESKAAEVVVADEMGANNSGKLGLVLLLSCITIQTAIGTGVIANNIFFSCQVPLLHGTF